MSSFFSKFNIRLILIHLAAFWCFFFAAETFGFLHDHLFLDSQYVQLRKAQFPERFQVDMTIIEQAGNVGILIAYVLAWFIATAKRWHWINDVIAFAIGILLGNKGWFGWAHLYKIFWAPGKIFVDNGFLSYLTDGLVMLAIGLAILYSKSLIRFIDNGQSKDKAALVAEKKARRVR
jgi:hypothetical protein